MITLRAADMPAVPWKNGGGVTRDLLCWPDAAAWKLRISLADIATDGPFSDFPGVQRWFAVVEGAGVELAFGARRHVQRVEDAPLIFDGAHAPGCRLLNGPTRDLNVMLRGVRGCMRLGQQFDEDWPQRGRFDLPTQSLDWGLPPGPMRCHAPALWIGVEP